SLFLSSLFSQPSTAHPSLHSFPTRRSSDLDRRRRQHCIPGNPAHAPCGHVVCLLRLVVIGLCERIGSEDLVPPGALLVVGPAGGDRKSTRLNSSHVKISYAVFCLKKKK